jgi:hypothetical protein
MHDDAHFPADPITPTVLYGVVDKNGAVSTANNAEHARAKAICYDNDYPSMAPHRAIVLREVGPA